MEMDVEKNQPTLPLTSTVPTGVSSSSTADPDPQLRYKGKSSTLSRGWANLPIKILQYIASLYIYECTATKILPHSLLPIPYDEDIIPVGLGHKRIRGPKPDKQQNSNNNHQHRIPPCAPLISPGYIPPIPHYAHALANNPNLYDSHGAYDWEGLALPPVEGKHLKQHRHNQQEQDFGREIRTRAAFEENKRGYSQRNMWILVRDMGEMERLMAVCKDWYRALESHEFWSLALKSYDPAEVTTQYGYHTVYPPQASSSPSKSHSQNHNTNFAAGAGSHVLHIPLTPHTHFKNIFHLSCFICRINHPQSNTHGLCAIPHAYPNPSYPTYPHPYTVPGKRESSIGSKYRVWLFGIGGLVGVCREHALEGDEFAASMHTNPNGNTHREREREAKGTAAGKWRWCGVCGIEEPMPSAGLLSSYPQAHPHAGQWTMSGLAQNPVQAAALKDRDLHLLRQRDRDRLEMVGIQFNEDEDSFPGVDWTCRSCRAEALLGRMFEASHQIQVRAAKLRAAKEGLDLAQLLKELDELDHELDDGLLSSPPLSPVSSSLGLPSLPSSTLPKSSKPKPPPIRTTAIDPYTILNGPLLFPSIRDSELSTTLSSFIILGEGTIEEVITCAKERGWLWYETRMGELMGEVRESRRWEARALKEAKEREEKEKVLLTEQAKAKQMEMDKVGREREKEREYQWREEELAAFVKEREYQKREREKIIGHDAAYYQQSQTHSHHHQHQHNSHQQHQYQQADLDEDEEERERNRRLDASPVLSDEAKRFLKEEARKLRDFKSSVEGSAHHHHTPTLPPLGRVAVPPSAALLATTNASGMARNIQQEEEDEEARMNRRLDENPMLDEETKKILKDEARKVRQISKGLASSTTFFSPVSSAVGFAPYASSTTSAANAAKVNPLYNDEKENAPPPSTKKTKSNKSRVHSVSPGLLSYERQLSDGYDEEEDYPYSDEEYVYDPRDFEDGAFPLDANLEEREAGGAGDPTSQEMSYDIGEEGLGGDGKDPSGLPPRFRGRKTQPEDDVPDGGAREESVDYSPGYVKARGELPVPDLAPGTAVESRRVPPVQPSLSVPVPPAPGDAAPRRRQRHLDEPYPDEELMTDWSESDSSLSDADAYAGIGAGVGGYDSDPSFLMETETNASVKELALNDWARARVMRGEWVGPLDDEVQPLTEPTVKHPVPWSLPQPPTATAFAKASRKAEGAMPPTHNLSVAVSHAFRKTLMSVLLPGMRNVLKKQIVGFLVRQLTSISIKQSDSILWSEILHKMSKLTLEDVFRDLEDDEGVWFEGVDWVERERNLSSAASSSSGESPTGATPPPFSLAQVPKHIGDFLAPQSHLSSPRLLPSIPYIPSNIQNLPAFSLDMVKSCWREALKGLFAVGPPCDCTVCERARKAEVAEAAAAAAAAQDPAQDSDAQYRAFCAQRDAEAAARVQQGHSGTGAAAGATGGTEEVQYEREKSLPVVEIKIGSRSGSPLVSSLQPQQQQQKMTSTKPHARCEDAELGYASDDYIHDLDDEYDEYDDGFEEDWESSRDHTPPASTTPNPTRGRKRSPSPSQLDRKRAKTEGDKSIGNGELFEEDLSRKRSSEEFEAEEEDEEEDNPFLDKKPPQGDQEGKAGLPKRSLAQMWLSSDNANRKRAKVWPTD